MDNELHFPANDMSFEGLTVDAMVKGIGRKATDEELYNYLFKVNDVQPITLEAASSRYSDKK